MVDDLQLAIGISVSLSLSLSFSFNLSISHACRISHASLLRRIIPKVRLVNVKVGWWGPELELENPATRID